MSYDIDLTKVRLRSEEQPWHLDIKLEVDGENAGWASYLDNYEILNWHEFVADRLFEDSDYDDVVSEIQRLLGNAGWTWSDDNGGEWRN